MGLTALLVKSVRSRQACCCVLPAVMNRVCRETITESIAFMVSKTKAGRREQETLGQAWGCPKRVPLLLMYVRR